MIDDVKKYLLDLQNRICQMLELEDTKAKFIEDKWQYENGSGGGLTRVLTDGAIIEKAGVNFSHVKGMKLPEAATANRPGLSNSTFEAMGVSVVIHPLNPYIPTTHMNVRCILVERENEEPYWWFGGGFDLTPYYGFEEDCVHWHQTAKDACDAFGDDVYANYKKWCDDYFYLKNRQEPRGIGGVFFDDLRDWDFETCFAFIKSIGDSFIKAYQPIVAKRKLMTYGAKEREFQLIRRGRYVEFNLLYDRGTLFGLQSGGRTESILMSLPPQVSWVYDFKPEPNSPEADLYEKFLKPRDWVGSKK